MIRYLSQYGCKVFHFFKTTYPFDDMNESTNVEFTEESSDDEDIVVAVDFTYTPENLEAGDEEDSENILSGKAGLKVTLRIQFCIRKSYAMTSLKQKNVVCFLM